VKRETGGVWKGTYGTSTGKAQRAEIRRGKKQKRRQLAGEPSSV